MNERQNAEQLLRRGRELQVAIQRRGGPGPSDVGVWRRSIATLDAVELELGQGGLGFLPFLYALGMAVAGLAAMAAAVGVVYVAKATIPAAADAARGVTEATGTVAKLAPWVLGGWLLLQLAKGEQRKRRPQAVPA